MLLERNHSVTAFTHGTVNLQTNPRLTIISGDIHNKSDIKAALAHADLIISTLGSWGTKKKDTLTAGMKNIIPAMEKLSIKRIVSLTGAGVLLPGDSASWYDYLNPLLLKIIAPRILADGERHIELLVSSQLEWTVLRSPVMKDGAIAGYTLRSRPPLPWKRVARNDVATALVDLAESGSYVRSAPFIQ